ncbi:AAA family ATPase [Paenisporosarcina sp. NPDC076898]|uniref:ATP-binding protein n=1 Tax=unclassified Paenisporosarcina TaxID=2642018 RepID=UPI003CFEA06D
MQIQKLVIYGFGQHEDVTIELKDGINVFYGWNEAGKTTIQQFILSILFGFPLRNQTQMRYEPKGGGRYGGQVYIKHGEFGDVVIERVKGKSAGDVTVYFEDGSRGQEESLKKVLYRYDRNSFESIFSFSIHQLQNFDKMTEEELSRTLLSSGTTGVDSLARLEQRATKELNSLFKKSGKNPEMNVKIEEIRLLDQSLKEARTKFDQYEPSILRIAEIDRELETLNSAELKLKYQNEQFAKHRQAKPLMDRLNHLQSELADIQQSAFPVDGIRRYETIKDRMHEVRIQLERLQQSIQLQQQQANELWSVEQTRSLEELLAKESEWHHWMLRKQQLVSELDQVKLDIQQQGRMLGIKDKYHFAQVLEMDVSLQNEEFFQQVMHRLQQAEENIRFELQSCDRIKIEKEETERRIEQLRATAPTEKELHKSENVQKLIREVSELKARQKLEKQPAKMDTNIPHIITALIFIAGIMGAIFSGNWIFAIGGMMLAGLIFVLLKKMNVSPDREAVDYSSQIVTLEEELSKAEHLANQVRLYNERLDQLKQKYQDQQRVILNIEHSLNMEEEKQKETKEALSDFLKLHGFTELLHPRLFPELFKRIRHIQEHQQMISQKTTEVQSLEENIKARLEEMSDATGEALSKEHAYHRLRELFNTVKGKRREHEIYQENMKDWKVQLTEKEKLLHAHSEEIQKLWNEAQVDSEHDFYQADVAFRLKQSLLQELQSIQAQLQSIGEISTSLGEDQEQEAYMAHMIEQADKLSSSRHDLLEEKALLRQQTTSMLSDEHYGDTLQKLEQKKTELAELAYKWSVNKAVSEAIKQTISNLKENRLPTVLEKAQQFFKHLTNGRYETLEVNDSGTFEVVHEKGMRYQIVELSQATKEQAYIAMRFALAESLLNSVPFPLVMDDPFVHFDRFRVKQMVQLMTDLEKQHQFLYFTCHEEMTTIWTHAHIIDVASMHKERRVSSV